MAGGRALDPQEAAPFAVDLGPLLHRVRIHDDAHGHSVAGRAGAAALTRGSHVYFADAMYQRNGHADRQLLGHELAHVSQQHRADGPPSGYRARPGDAWELEADEVAAGTRRMAPAQGAARVVEQRRTAAEQIATVLRSAMRGLGTDEEAIFSALTGRSSDEIGEIETAYAALSGGETLEAALRDELSGAELGRAMSLLRGESAATEAARQLYDAVEGLGTDEEAIYAAVAGRSEAQWTDIQTAYQALAGESLMARLEDELTGDEWTYVQTLLPGAEGGAESETDRATVIANRIEAAVSGPGTDEAAIFSALTGRNSDEIEAIERGFRLLTGEVLRTRLRDELDDEDYARVSRLMHPEESAERIARQLFEAMEGPGTDETAIVGLLTGRSTDELEAIRSAYDDLDSVPLADRLRDELSGTELTEALGVESAGVLAAEDEIYLSVRGPSRDDERLFAVLEELRAQANPRQAIRNAIDQYRSKGYGDMIRDIESALTGSDEERARRLLVPEWVETEDCTAGERTQALDAIEGAIGMANHAASVIATDESAGALSVSVSTALSANFNPGGTAGAVDLALATRVRGVLENTRGDLETKSDLKCTQDAGPCDSSQSCSQYTYGWTYGLSGATVRICPAFFSCVPTPDQRWAMLHEFVHHTGVDDKAYHYEPTFSTLVPAGDGSARDSLDNADSYAHFANSV